MHNTFKLNFPDIAEVVCVPTSVLLAVAFAMRRAAAVPSHSIRITDKAKWSSSLGCLSKNL